MNRINFMGVIACENCNPNGDPAAGNRPRQTFDGRGEISDVAMKRRIRDRLLEAGHRIFVQADPAADGYKSLQAPCRRYNRQSKRRQGIGFHPPGLRGMD